MRPLFNDLSVSHDEDAIRLPDGGEPVRNNKAGAALHHSGKRALHINFRACIDAARRFIQNQHRRIGEHYARDTQQLALPLGEIAAILCKHSIVAAATCSCVASGRP